MTVRGTIISVSAIAFLACLACLSAEAREIRTPVTPLKVEMNFLSPAGFQKVCPGGDWACSDEGRGVCQVWLRASGEIWGQTESGMAGFSNQHLVAEVAHELLHCYKGAWHPE